MKLEHKYVDFMNGATFNSPKGEGWEFAGITFHPQYKNTRSRAYFLREVIKEDK